MATLRIPASTYYLSNSSYLKITDASNMYTDTDSNTYATITNSQSGTTTYYTYIRGFDFSLLPTGAIVNSFSIKFKARESGITTSTSYRPYLCNGTSALTSQCSMPSTSVQTLTFSGYDLDWDDLVSYGSNFGIRINCRRASRSTTGYMYIYGAEIEVDYTIPIKHTLIVEDNGYNVTPSGTIDVYEGASQEIVINEATMPKALLDGVDITNQFVLTSLATSYSGYPSNSSYTGVQSGTNAIAYAVGNSAENPASNTTCWYGSSSATVDSQYAQYTFDLSDIPSNAVDIVVSCKVAGASENGTYSHTSGGKYSVWALCSNGTSKGSQVYTTSTSTTIIEFSDTGSWTRSELDNLQLRHYVGYYGGRTNGATLTINYSLPGSSQVYVYTLVIDDDHTLVLGGTTEQPSLWAKLNGSWVKANKVYKKINGKWVEQTDITNIFENGKNYILGGV